MSTLPHLGVVHLPRSGVAKKYKGGDCMETLVSVTGSKGNATVISDGETMLQIDCGVGYNNVNSLCGYKLYECKDVIVSHGHSINGRPHQ